LAARSAKMAFRHRVTVRVQPTRQRTGKCRVAPARPVVSDLAHRTARGQDRASSCLGTRLAAPAATPWHRCRDHHVLSSRSSLTMRSLTRTRCKSTRSARVRPATVDVAARRVPNMAGVNYHIRQAALGRTSRASSRSAAAMARAAAALAGRLGGRLGCAHARVGIARVAWPAEPGAPMHALVSRGQRAASASAATLWCVVGEPACSRPADAPRAVWCPIPPARGRARGVIHECEHVVSCAGGLGY
jgi:hypothetical protein